MKLNKTLYTLAAVALTFSATSCKDFLDTMPDTRVELNTVEKARMLLVDSYPAVNPALVGEFTSDNIEDNNTQDASGNRFNLSYYGREDDEIFAFEQVLSASDNDTPSGLWSGYYGAIAGANATLDALEKLEQRIANGETLDDAAKIPAIRGEALLIRAFSHYMLANIFCEQYRGPELSKALLGLHYITKPETTVKPHYKRADLAATYDMIRKDLEEGLPLIDNAIYSIPKYHFNKAAAHSFAARFYLTTREYKKVVEHCNTAFGGEGVDASAYMSDFWAHPGDFFYASDMGLYAQGMDKARNFMLIPTYSVAIRHLSGSHRYSCTRDAKRATVQGPGPTWQNFKYRNSQTNETFSMHPAFNGLCGVNGKAQYGTIFYGNLNEQFEITNKVAQTGYAHCTRAEFTGEETLLMRAEAKLFLGDKNGAIADLNIWEKARRNTPNVAGNEDKFDDLTEAQIIKFYVTRDPGYGIVKPIHIDEVYPCDYSVSDDMLPILQCIQHFRRIEFVHTGVRFFDLKRYGIEWSHKIGAENRIETMSLFDPRRAIQIPSEIQAAGHQPNPVAYDRAMQESFSAVSYKPAQGNDSENMN